MPGAIIAAAHVPAYWNPATVARIGGVSPEDLVWIMAAGGISWYLAAFTWRAHLTAAPKPRVVARRMLAIGAPAVLVMVGAAVVAEGRYVMPVNLGLMLVLAAVLGRLRPDGRVLAVSGALGFAGFHLLEDVVFLASWPEAIGYWVPEAELPFRILGVPAYEVLWAAGYGAVWPLLVFFACDVRFTEPASSPGSRAG